MNLQSAASGFLAFLLLIPALRGKTDWKVTYTPSNICASKGSTVNINCTYEYPAEKKKSKPHNSSIVLESQWFTKIDRNNPVDIGKETDYKGRIDYSCGESQCPESTCSGACTLSIRDLKPSDSAEYKFWRLTAQTDWGYTGSPGVNLTVTDLQVKLEFLHSDEPTRLDLECHSICDITTTSYQWFRNGENTAVTQGTGRYYGGQVKDNRVIINSEDSYACAVKGFERFPSPSVYAPKTPSVTVSPSDKVEEGSSVTLSCSSDANPAATYTWFKEQDDSVKESGQNYTLSSMTSEHGGHYYCQAYNAIGNHNSTLSFVNVTARSSSSSSSSGITAAAVGTVAVFLATVLFLIFLWLRRRRASRKARDQGGRPDTTEEGEPREQQYSFLNFPRSETQEVPDQLAGSHVQSNPTEQVLYSAVQFQRSNAVAEGCDQTESGQTSEMYSTVQKKPRV